MNIEQQDILSRLRNIEAVLQSIKRNMPNKDMFLTSEEEVLLEESYENGKKGILASSSETRKKLGV